MKKLFCLLLVSALLLTAAACGGNTVPAETAADKTFAAETESVAVPAAEPVEENNMTGEELAAAMGVGWNLGNTFDAPDGEISWGNPMTTKELLVLLKELGFSTIRIPISWGKHVTPGPDFTIDESFMKRIDTVVNQALDAGLYVIINSHHDNFIYTPKPENEELGKKYLTAIWTQIAEHFKDADYRLIFQTMNEPRVEGTSYEWTINTKNADCMASLEVINQLNQAALDAIRAVGGKNSQRFVVVSPYAGSPEAAVNSAFRLPEDSAEGKLIVSVHAYRPYNMALNAKSPESSFGPAGVADITAFMKSVNYRFIKKGIPVVIDEMGALDKQNPEARYEWAKAYASAAKKYGMPCLWWDNGALGTEGENFGMINRRKLAVYEESMTAYQGLMDGLSAEE